MPPSHPRAPTANRCIDTLSELVRTFRTIQISRGRHPWLLLDMTMAQLKAMMLLAQSGGLRSRELADGLGIAPSAATPLVDRLVKQLLVTRESDAEDRRIIWIRPTAKSTALYDQLIQETNRPVLEEVLAGVPREERQKVYESMLLLLDSAQRVLDRKERSVRKRKRRT